MNPFGGDPRKLMKQLQQAQERMQQAAVAHIDLGGFDLPFAQVLEPRRELPHHEILSVNDRFSW